MPARLAILLIWQSGLAFLKQHNPVCRIYIRFHLDFQAACCKSEKHPIL